MYKEANNINVYQYAKLKTLQTGTKTESFELRWYLVTALNKSQFYFLSCKDSKDYTVLCQLIIHADNTEIIMATLYRPLTRRETHVLSPLNLAE